MKRSDRRYAMLIGGDGQTSNKGEHRKRGFSSRLQYHNMLSLDNVNNRKYREKSMAAKKLTFENTWAHVDIPKFKRYYITKTAMELVVDYFGDKIPDWFKETDIKRCSSYYDDKSTYAWRPVVLADGLKDARIYYTTVNMIDYCDRLFHLFPDTQKEVQLALLEIQDSYAMLSLHMELKSMFLDSQLEGYKEDSGFLSPLETFDPNQGPVFSISEIPDVLNYILLIPFWREDETISTDNILIKRFIFILYKCLPYPYKRRSVENAIVESWSDMLQRVFLKNSDKNDLEKERMEQERKYTKDLYQIVIRVLMASLVGVYEHCNVRANIIARRRIYKWLCFNRPNQEDMSLWILKYKELVLCAFREYLFKMVDEVGGLVDFLADISYWNVLKFSTYKMMDKVRADINTAMKKYQMDYNICDSGFENIWVDTDLYCQMKSRELDNIYNQVPTFDWHFGMPWFSKIQHDLDAVNRNILKNSNRPKTHTFEEMGLLKMDEVEADMKKKNKTNYRAIDPDLLEEQIKGFIQFSIKSCGQFQPISYTWLGDYPVNFSPEYIVKIQEAEDAYEYEAGASAMKGVFEEMYRIMPYEYQILKWYFKCIVQKRSLLIYDLPKDLHEKQIKNLREKVYELKEGEELGISAGLYYVCENCCNIKITVRDVSQLNNPKSLGGWTSEGVCINLDDGRFFCTHMYSKETPKKRNPTKLIMKEIIATNKEKNDEMDCMIAVGAAKRFMNLNDIKELRRLIKYEDRATLDKYIDKREQQERCLNTELKPIYLPGKMIQTKNDIVIACPECLHPVAYSRNMFRSGVENMSCGCKDKKCEVDFNCYICGSDCHEYCFVKAIWDDDTQGEEESFKIVCLCEEHRNKWTTEENYVIRASQLDREAKQTSTKNKKTNKRKQEPKKPKKPKHQDLEADWSVDLKRAKKPPKKKKKITESIEKKMRGIKAKNKSIGKPLYKV